jgi:sugar phosphate isomerase/epimerase
MTPQIGLQLFSVRNALEHNYATTLEKVAAIGYKNLELICTVTEAGLVFGRDLRPSEHRKLLESLGLKAVGCHVMPKDGVSWEKIVDSALETGANSLVIPFALFKDRQDVLSLCGQTNQAAEICKKRGVQLYYHNHIQEFEIFDGKMVMDIMLENLDSDLVMFEFDSYWAIRGGQDPIAWIQKLGKRCDLLHQKDLPQDVQPVNLFDLAAGNPQITTLEMLMSVGADQFTEIGTGVLEISEIIEAGRTHGSVRYVFVEQDKTSKDELESVTISYHNLSRLLA